MTLLLPEHIARKREAELALAQTGAVSPAQEALQKAYVASEERVFDPTKLPESAIDRLPQPTGWRILLIPYQGRATSKGGIHVPDTVREREFLATVCGYVLRVGPEAYADTNKFPHGAWCKQGDWVIFGRYAGARFRLEEGGEVRLLNDDEILATISDPSDIFHV